MRWLPLLLCGCSSATAGLPGWSTGGGGGGGGAGSLNGGLWHYSVRPDTPHANDDYFDDVTGCENWDVPGTESTVALDEYGRGAAIDVVANSTGWTGCIQALPAGTDLTVTVPVRFDSRYGIANQLAGILVGEDLSTGTGAPSTGDFWVLYQAGSSGAGVDINWQRWSAYATFASTLEQFVNTDIESFRLLRLFVDDTNTQISALVSSDGQSWLRVGNPASTAGVTLGSIGIAGNTDNATDALVIYGEFIQISETTDPYEPMGGLLAVE